MVIAIPISMRVISGVYLLDCNQDTDANIKLRTLLLYRNEWRHRLQASCSTPFGIQIIVKREGSSHIDKYTYIKNNNNVKTTFR